LGSVAVIGVDGGTSKTGAVVLSTKGEALASATVRSSSAYHRESEETAEVVVVAAVEALSWRGPREPGGSSVPSGGPGESRAGRWHGTGTRCCGHRRHRIDRLRNRRGWPRCQHWPRRPPRPVRRCRRPAHSAETKGGAGCHGRGGGRETLGWSGKPLPLIRARDMFVSAELLLGPTRRALERASCPAEIPEAALAPEIGAAERVS
jgi:hypothetical protein